MMKLFAHSRPISVTIFVLLGLLVTHTGNARAFGVYPSGTTGRSISWPQCGGAFTSQPGTFGIVGVTGGRAFYQNPCLVSEYHWAQSAQVAPSLIMNLNAPVGTTAFKAQTGPRGTCAPTDAVCLSYNYGYNAAQSAFADAQSQGTPSSTWWLDVETDNSWADESAQNTQVIQGAIDFLRSQSITTGIYSAARDWQKIAGGFRPDLPVWLAGTLDQAAAPAGCAQSNSFDGGPVWLVQFTITDYDGVYACGAAVPATAAALPATIPPASPANVQAVAVDSGTIQLSWMIDAAAGASVLLYGDGAPLVTLAGPTTSYTVAALAPGTYHCYILIASNAAGFSAWSNWACAATPS